MQNFVSINDGTEKYWLPAALRFVEFFSENTYTGFVEIKGFRVIDPHAEAVPFRWERNDDSSLTVNAVDLSVGGIRQDDYYY